MRHVVVMRHVFEKNPVLVVAMLAVFAFAIWAIANS
jgi:hypothetical protein